MKASKKSVTIGIPAYNAEKNIKKLIISLLNQKQTDFKIEVIYIYSDNSDDNTVKNAKKINNKKVFIIDAKVRRGFAYGFKKLLSLNKSDLMLLLNDDVVINDNLFIDKTIRQFENKKVGFICSNPQPLKSNSLIETGMVSGFNAFERMRKLIKHGNNVHTCDGKSMTLSNNFIKSIKFPKNLAEMGNLDDYIYFSCLESGFFYKFEPEAILYFKMPSTLSDFIKWMTRNSTNQHILIKTFGKVVQKEYAIPLNAYIMFCIYRLIEFIKNPLACVIIYFAGIYSRFKARSMSKSFTTTWDLVESTKKL